MKSMKNCVVNLRHKFFSEKGLLLKVPGLLLEFGSFKRWNFQFFCRLIFAQSELQNKNLFAKKGISNVFISFSAQMY